MGSGGEWALNRMDELDGMGLRNFIDGHFYERIEAR